MHITTFDNDNDWLEWRKKGVGGSGIATASTGRYGGATKIVATKIGLPDPNPIDPKLAKRGHKWEQAIADGVHAHTGMCVVGEQTGITHADNPRHLSTVDGLLSPYPRPTHDQRTAGLEIKTRGTYAESAWDYWNAQCQWAMYVTGLPQWLLAVGTIEERYDLNTGRLAERLTGVRYTWIERDDYEIVTLIHTADWLLEHIDRGELPEPSTAEALPWVKQAHNVTPKPGSAPDAEIDADDVERYLELKTAITTAKDEIDAIEARIRHTIGEHNQATTENGQYRVRIGNPRRAFTAQSEADFVATHGDQHPEYLKTVVDRTALKTADPDLYDQYRVPISDRRLTIKDLHNKDNPHD